MSPQHSRRDTAEASRELWETTGSPGLLLHTRAWLGRSLGNDGGQVLDILKTKGRDWIHWAGSSRTAGVGKLLLRQWGEGGTGETRAGMACGVRPGQD